MDFVLLDPARACVLGVVGRDDGGWPWIVILVHVAGCWLVFKVEVEELASEGAETLDVTEVTAIRSILLCKESSVRSSSVRSSNSP